jgi:hypothetical protein
MPLIRIPNGYQNLKPSDLLDTASFIRFEIASRTAVFVTPNPSMTELGEVIDEYAPAVAAAQDGSKVLADQRDLIGERLINMLHNLSYYVLFTAQGNRSIVLQSGFKLAKEPVPIVMAPPTGGKLENGNQPGTLISSVKRVRGARSYNHQYTTDPLLAEGSWITIGCTVPKCHLTGLVPGTKYYVRVGAIGPREQVLYSDVMSKIVS